MKSWNLQLEGTMEDGRLLENLKSSVAFIADQMLWKSGNRGKWNIKVASLKLRARERLALRRMQAARKGLCYMQKSASSKENGETERMRHSQTDLDVLVIFLGNLKVIDVFTQAKVAF